MELPRVLEQLFLEDVEAYEGREKMPFITSLERFAMEKETLRLIERQLRVKFGEEGPKLMPEIVALDDPEKYDAIVEKLVTDTTLDELRAACAKLAVPAPTPKKGKSGKK
jgi:hypothetical protein